MNSHAIALRKHLIAATLLASLGACELPQPRPPQPCADGRCEFQLPGGGAVWVSQEMVDFFVCALAIKSTKVSTLTQQAAYQIKVKGGGGKGSKLTPQGEFDIYRGVRKQESATLSTDKDVLKALDRCESEIGHIPVVGMPEGGT